MGKSNVVFWENQGPDDIIYAYEHDDLRTLTSVTVPEHAVAIFARDGQLTGILEPGRHMITSSNIPWLTKLYNLALGYKETPFKVQIIFVSLKMFNGKWGIRSMIKAAQGYDVPITLMANGDYQFRISDVSVFYTQVLGGLKSYTTGDLNAFMKGFINEQVTQQLSKQYYMEVYGSLENASTTTKVMVEQYFLQRGIELLSLKIAEVRTTDEDQKKIFEYEPLHEGVQIAGRGSRHAPVPPDVSAAPAAAPLRGPSAAAGRDAATADPQGPLPVLRIPERVSLQVLQQLRQAVAPGAGPATSRASAYGRSRPAQVQQLPVLRPEHQRSTEDSQVLPVLLRAAVLIQTAGAARHLPLLYLLFEPDTAFINTIHPSFYVIRIFSTNHDTISTDSTKSEQNLRIIHPAHDSII